MNKWTKLKRIKPRNFLHRHENNNVISAKWVFRNKKNENVQVVRNKSRLVCKGYAQIEGIDFEEILSLIERMEAIRMFFSFAYHKHLKIYQME